MLCKKMKNRCKKAVKTATAHRTKKGGYMLTMGDMCIGHSDDLPEIGGRNPICVDDDGDCFIPLDRVLWQCATNTDKLPPPVKSGEHISVVAVEQMVYTFPRRAQQIIDWFSACTVPKNGRGWKKMEHYTLGQILDNILRGRSADEVLF